MDNKRKFNSEHRKKIMNKITKVNDKYIYIRIFKIVKKELGSNLSSNKNGIFFNINLLSDKSIDEIVNILNEHSINTTETISQNTLQYNPYSVENISESNKDCPRLSNQEMNLIKKLRKNR